MKKLSKSEETPQKHREGDLRVPVLGRASTWIVILIVGALAWDLYPFVHWQFVKGKVLKTVGKPLAEAESEYARLLLKSRIRQFGPRKYVEMHPRRLSRISIAILEFAIWYDRSRSWSYLYTGLFPSALIQLDDSDTLTRVQYMY